MTRSDISRSGTAAVPERHEVAIVLSPGFSHLSLPAVTEPLFIANWLLGEQTFGWRTLSVDGLAVPTSSGVSVPVDAPLGPDDGPDTVLLLASFDTRRTGTDERLLGWLRRVARSDAVIGGIETGSEVLAAAGLLDGRRVAVHWYNADGFRERFPRVIAEPARTLTDGRFVSSAGASATLDLMIGLIARHATDAISGEVARHLLAPYPATGPRSAPDPGRRPGDPVVQRALALIGERLDETGDCAALAHELGISLRQLQRRFRAVEGRPLGGAWREARFARAHQLVQQTELSLTEISVATGYGSVEAFSRAYRRRFGIPPSQDRNQTTATSVYRPTPDTHMRGEAS